jgi:uncharacterized protein YfaA (DUF2138 family)
MGNKNLLSLFETTGDDFCQWYQNTNDRIGTESMIRVNINEDKQFYIHLIKV